MLLSMFNSKPPSGNPFGATQAILSVLLAVPPMPLAGWIGFARIWEKEIDYAATIAF